MSRLAEVKTDKGDQAPIQEQFVIEKNVPVPPGRRTGSRIPFARMEIGDSVFLPGDPKKFNSVSVAAAKKYGFKFTQRRVGGGVRIWRVA